MRGINLGIPYQFTEKPAVLVTVTSPTFAEPVTATAPLGPGTTPTLETVIVAIPLALVSAVPVGGVSAAIARGLNVNVTTVFGTGAPALSNTVAEAVSVGVTLSTELRDTATEIEGLAGVTQIPPCKTCGRTQIGGGTTGTAIG